MKVLGYFGRFQPEKGIVKYLKQEYEPSKFPKFVIYGDGKGKNKLLDIVANRRLQNHVFIRGLIQAVNSKTGSCFPGNNSKNSPPQGD